ncbi:MAG: hypothetical protein RX317_07470 [bacterium]|nr:hypothetical protein [bacterium]
MSLEEAIEATKVHSVAGLTRSNGALITRRPFRGPGRLNWRCPESSPSTTAPWGYGRNRFLSLHTETSNYVILIFSLEKILGIYYKLGEAR